MSWKKFVIVNSVIMGAREVVLNYSKNLVDSHDIDKTYTLGKDGFEQELDTNDKKVLGAIGTSLFMSFIFVLYNLVTGVRALKKKNFILAVAAMMLPLTQPDFKFEYKKDSNELELEVDEDTIPVR